MASKFKKFARYVRRWAKVLNVDHYELRIEEHQTNDAENDGAAAEAVLYVSHNCAIISYYPAANEMADDRLWYLACHEVVHIATAPIFDMLRRLADLDEKEEKEVQITLEHVVDNLSRQLVKLLPASKQTAILKRENLLVFRGRGATNEDESNRQERSRLAA